MAGAYLWARHFLYNGIAVFEVLEDLLHQGYKNY